MSFDYKPVSLEEYNQSLRDAVNVYYTPAINNQSMSREDALKSTGEMAEKYLDAAQEFQEAQNAIVENNTEIIQETTEVENGTVTETSNVEATSEDASVDNNGLDGRRRLRWRDGSLRREGKLCLITLIIRTSDPSKFLIKKYW